MAQTYKFWVALRPIFGLLSNFLLCVVMWPQPQGHLKLSKSYCQKKAGMISFLEFLPWIRLSSVRTKAVFWSFWIPHYLEQTWPIGEAHWMLVWKHCPLTSPCEYVYTHLMELCHCLCNLGTRPTTYACFSLVHTSIPPSLKSYWVSTYGRTEVSTPSSSSPQS